jgi:DNA-directed RNA polymerase specialized sigma subunit
MQLKIPEYLYVDYENEKREIPKKLAPKMHKISDVEECVLKRRRNHMTQADVAKELGISRLWVNRMEQGTEPADRLIEFWRKG